MEIISESFNYINSKYYENDFEMSSSNVVLFDRHGIKKSEIKTKKMNFVFEKSQILQDFVEMFKIDNKQNIKLITDSICSCLTKNEYLKAYAKLIFGIKEKDDNTIFKRIANYFKKYN